MIGASSGAAGSAGYFPAPQAGDEGKLPRGDGTWVTALGDYSGEVAGGSVAATSTSAGDWYVINAAGTSQSITWAVGDIAIYEGTSGNWSQVAGTGWGVPAASDAEAIAGVENAKYIAPDTLHAYGGPRFANRAPIALPISDGATSNRGIVQTGTARTNLAGAPVATWRGLVYVPESDPTVDIVVHQLAGSATAGTTFYANELVAIILSNGNLTLQQWAAAFPSNRYFLYTDFRAAYSGQYIFLEVAYANGTTAPVVRVNDIDISASFATGSAGTVPDWLDATMIGSFLVAGYNWPSGPAPLGQWINGALSDADRTYWRTTGQPPEWVVAGGSMVSITAGSFVSGTEYTITTVGTTDFTLIGAASSTVGLRFTSTGVGTGTGTAVKAGALSIPVQGPDGIVLDGTRSNAPVIGTMTGMRWSKTSPVGTRYGVPKTYDFGDISTTAATTAHAILPAGWVVRETQLNVITAFDASRVLDVGISGTPEAFASDMALDAIAYVLEASALQTPSASVRTIYLQLSASVTVGKVAVDTILERIF